MNGSRHIKPIKRFSGEFCLHGDKSIMHRAIMLNAAAEGSAEIVCGDLGEDCLTTIDCMRQLGAEIEVCGDTVKIKGTAGKFRSNKVLDCKNSGTTMRLLAGLLAGAGVTATLVGDTSLSRRPMDRVVLPLKKMGADITSADGLAPIFIRPAQLSGIRFDNIYNSAQVKSAVLLAGLNAKGVTEVLESTPTRNHTETMLADMGANIEVAGFVEGADTEATGCTISIKSSRLTARNMTVPSDISSAAFLLGAAAILKGSAVTIKNIEKNPTRDGILRALKSMGAGVIERPSGKLFDITVGGVGSGDLEGINIEGEIVPSLIDEVPLICVVACFARGTTVIKGVNELRLKECDRIEAIVKNLRAMGAKIEADENSITIFGQGGEALMGGVEVDSYHDHRIAMAMAVAGLTSKHGVTIHDADCVNISFANFWEVIK